MMKSIMTARSVLKNSRLLSTVSAVPQLKPTSHTQDIISEMPPCDFEPPIHTGISYEQIRQVREDYLSPALKALTFYRKPLAIHQGYKQWLFDLEGNRYLDMLAGVSTVVAGHSHPRIIDAAARQMSKLLHTSSIYCHPAHHEYAEKLAAKLPDPLKVIYLVNSGSEANDLALLMSRLYTGCSDTLTLKGAYHGNSPSAMGITSISSWYFNYPSSTTTHKMKTPDPYKGSWGGKACRDSHVQADRSCSCKPGYCEASDKYVDEVKETLNYCTPKEKMGPFFAESIMGVNGIVQFPKGYIKGAAEAVRARNGLVVLDEVQTGFGRTGDNFWGFEGHDVVPDITVMAKGIGNGFPMAAVVTTKEIASVMTQAVHFNTFGGNPVGCAIASTVLDIIDDEKLQENARDVGSYFILELAKLRSKYESVGDVRGKGLMIGVELVENKISKSPLPVDQVADIFEDLKDMRVLCGKGGGLGGNVLRFQPPLCITKDDADYAVACLDQALFNHRERQSSVMS